MTAKAGGQAGAATLQQPRVVLDGPLFRVDNAENSRHLEGIAEAFINDHDRGCRVCLTKRTGAPSARRDVTLGIAVILVRTIAYASLSLFGSLGALFQSDAEPEPIEIVFESLNRAGIEDSLANETGWFTMSDLRERNRSSISPGASCLTTAVQASRGEMQGWKDLADSNGVGFVIAYGAWYTEDLAYLNTSGGAYTVPTYPTVLAPQTRPS